MKNNQLLNGIQSLHIICKSAKRQVVVARRHTNCSGLYLGYHVMNIAKALCKLDGHFQEKQHNIVVKAL